MCVGSYNVRVANAPAGYFVTEVENRDKKGIIIYIFKDFKTILQEVDEILQ